MLTECQSCHCLRSLLSSHQRSFLLWPLHHSQWVTLKGVQVAPVLTRLFQEMQKSMVAQKESYEGRLKSLEEELAVQSAVAQNAELWRKLDF